jgi:FkbM family methyltransferase
MKTKRFQSVLVGLYVLIPEGQLKHLLRLLAFRVNKGLPRGALVNRGDCVLQVGTPSPETIQYYMEMVGPTGRVIVVEPEKANYNRLTSDPVIAGAQGVTVLRRAAWSCREQMTLTVSKSEVDHKLEVSGIVHDNDYVPDNYCGTQTVQADTIDNILHELEVDRVDYAEIHVNGAEVEVLRGMTHALDRTKRLHVKGHALLQETGQPINRQISRMLRERGFRTFIGPRSKARDDAVAHGWRSRSGDVYASR